MRLPTKPLRRPERALLWPWARRSRIRDERVGIAHRQPLDIGHRQSETRPLQKRAHVAHIGEGATCGADAAESLAFGGGEAFAQFRQSRAAEQHGQEQPVRLEQRGGFGSSAPGRSLMACKEKRLTARSRGPSTARNSRSSKSAMVQACAKRLMRARQDIAHPHGAIEVPRDAGKPYRPAHPTPRRPENGLRRYGAARALAASGRCESQKGAGVPNSRRLD